jgi:signal transduction histidine kinase
MVMRYGGIAAAITVATIGIVAVALAVLAAPLEPEQWRFDPAGIWPWWPGRPGGLLIVFVSALVGLGLAAFVRRPHSGISQALLAGSAGNAGSGALWVVINPDALDQLSAEWLAFIAAGLLSLVLWSSLVHLVLVFPTRDSLVDANPWIVPLVHGLPQAAMLTGALLSGGLTPTSLEWVDAWGRIHAAIVSLLLLAALLGIGARFLTVSVARRRQVAGVAASVALAVLASLLLIDLPIAFGGAPLVERTAIVVIALPVPFFLALALWQDRNFRINRLRRSQLALIHARDEERRRLRRDLHDGLGPSLAAIGLKVDAAASYVERDPPRAQQLLEEVRRDLAAAVNDTRRLVRGLHPPVLTELGLVGAIQRAADELTAGAPSTGSAPDVTVDAQPLPPLPAPVEVAAYRIVHEALANVVRHAQAGHARVSISVEDGILHFAVADDGVGLGLRHRPGVGTQAMSERARELGGTFEIDSRSGAGTRVSVSLPLTVD